jgi:L-fucono-1,5-lactonase
MRSRAGAAAVARAAHGRSNSFQGTEAGARDNSMTRLDSHQHFWRYSAAEYPWISDRMGTLRRDFLPADFKPLLNQAGFAGSIAVQARQSLEETEWLLGLAAEHPFVRGVVGWVDLRAGDIRDQLARYSRRPGLVGVRHVVHDEPDDNFMLTPEFRSGISALDEFGLTYDLLLFPRHLPVATRLVREFPAQSFVLDHIAKPAIARGETEPWGSDIRRLAENPNVYCKLSGMVTEASWADWRPDDFRGYLDVIASAFGTGRLMIGSDWPVCTVSGDFLSTMRLVMGYLDSFPEAAREAVLGGNCATFYGIPGG